jgi:hypothetical protein
MHDVASLAATYGATPTYNQTFAESSFTYQKIYNGTTSTGALTTCTAYRTVWYQDAQSYTARANLVSQYHLGGLTEWTLGMEDPTAFQSIRNVALAIAPDAISASLSADSTSITVGTPTHLVATFLMPDKTPAAGIPVHLQTQDPGGVWTTIQDGVTQSDGTFLATLNITHNTNVRIYSDGTWQRLEGDSPTIAIKVSRALSWKIAASMKAGVPYAVTAQVTPAVAGVSVQLSNGATAMTDASGTVTFTVTNSTQGFTSYQMRILADPLYAATQSGFVIVWVR